MGNQSEKPLNSTWLKQLLEAETADFSGWDFSSLHQTMAEQPLCWDLKELITERLQVSDRLLDLGTGGGEFLQTLNHPPALTWVTENHPPNVALIKKRLSPLGVHVHVCDGAGPLPFADKGFDVVMNRHETLDFHEIARVLKPQGVCVVQQVGYRNNHDLAEKLLGHAVPHAPKTQTLEAYKISAVAAGFVIEYAEEMYPWIRFFRLSTLVRFAKIIDWEFPGFSVEGCLERLRALQKQLDQTGEIVGTEHRFVLALRKKAV